MSDDFTKLKDEEKEKLDSAHQEVGQSDAATPRAPGKNTWIPGFILIGLGLIFLISNVTGFQLDNWWALFILLPGAVNLVNAWNAYREDGRITRRVRGSLIGGLLISLIAFIFLFNLDWGNVWPVFLILGGFALLLSGWLDR